MNCVKVQDLLPDYSVDMLDARGHQEVSEHLSACAECQKELAILEGVAMLVETHGVRQPPPGLFNAVRNQILEGQVPQAPRPWWAFLWSAPARGAALGLSVAALALGVMLPVSSPKLPEGTLHPTLTIGSRSASSELANSIRQHAMAAADGPLAERVAWEAMAQLADTPETEGAARGSRALRNLVQPTGVD